MVNFLNRNGKTFKLIATIIAFSIAGVSAAQKPNVKKQFDQAAQQVGFMLTVINSLRSKPGAADLLSPRSVDSNGLKLVKGSDWTSGFFPGELWLLYEYTGERQWMDKAKQFTAVLAPQQFNRTTHDLGFMIYSSFGNGYRLTADTGYRNVIIRAAKTLCTRFNPVAGVIRSWDMTNDNKWQFPVIIDNMMNLEMLFEATKLTGDSSYYNIAVTHANTTMKHHFRSDYSSFHVVDYDPATGNVRQKNTAQGFSDGSSWARGQAWGLYGFTMCYRETQDPVYLEQAQHIAGYILKQLPAGHIPFWDYNAPGIPNEPKDASAAAITAAALYELSGYAPDSGYRKAADGMMKELCAHYLSPAGENNGFILLHSTGHKPAKSEIDVPLVYADYYFLEALMRSGKKR